MPHVDLIVTLTGSLAAALALGYVSHRFGLSPIVGYLLAGIAVGPNTPGFVADRAAAEQLAEVGVILLMFGVGLHFHFQELLAVRRIALPGAIGQSLIATLLGGGLTWSLGWSWSAGLMYGIAISVASTVVLTRVLADNHQLHTRTGHIAIGWLVVEDLLTVLVLVLLPALFAQPQPVAGQLVVALLWAVIKIVVLVLLVWLLAERAIHWLLNRMAASGSRELFTLSVLVIALGIAVASAKLFGVSMALGAFLAGMVVGRSEFSLRAASEALPLRDAFAVLFFVSVGMLFAPGVVRDNPLLVAATLAIVLVVKPLAALTIMLTMRYPLAASLSVAVALGQIGEFSFILAVLANKLRALDHDATNVLVVVAIVSISLNPLLYRALPFLTRTLAAVPALRRWVQAPSAFEGGDEDHAPSTRGPEHRAIVIGYGPVGRTLTRLLSENDIEPVVVELNIDTVRAIREQGIAAVYGDATRPETLTAAQVDSAGTLLLSAAGLENGAEIIRIARQLNPRIRVLARTAYIAERPSLKRAGADVVFSGEEKVAIAMMESMLRALGATPEQIDRERERIDRDLSAVDQDATP
ncbi:MAG TPA: cation:proton antiporter [Pirellulales bacterium]|nr:cation:proton antiporter [Pirellulales bacterium]